MPVSASVREKYAPIVEKYREKYPYLSNSKLATKIVNENKHIPYAAKSFRGIISTFITKNVEKENIDLDLSESEIDFELVKSVYKERPSFIVPSSVDEMLIMNDIHIPYHDMQALKTALRYAKDRNVNGILINGDMVDMYSSSRFNKVPDQTNAFFEIERGRMFLEQLRKLFPKIPIYYKFANHEERWLLKLYDKLPEASSDPDLLLEGRLKLDHYNIELIKDKRVIEYGKLNIIHGHEMFASSGAVNLARNFLLKSFDNIAFGHFHRTQDYMKPTIKHKNLGSFAIGCLCGLSPDYAPINDWNHGFAIAKRDNSGYFELENKMIINGQIK